MSGTDAEIYMVGDRLFGTNLLNAFRRHFWDTVSHRLGTPGPYRDLIRNRDMLNILVSETWVEPLSLDTKRREVSLQQGTFSIPHPRAHEGGPCRPDSEFTGIELSITMPCAGSQFLWYACPDGWSFWGATGRLTYGSLKLTARGALGTSPDEFPPKMRTVLEIIESAVAAQGEQIDDLNRNLVSWARHAIKEHNDKIRHLKRLIRDPFGLKQPQT